MRTIYRAMALALAGVATAAIAGDTPFTPDAAATWSARSLLMAKVYDDAADSTLSKQSFAVACNGLTGEQMKHEYGKEPRWALSSQIWICGAYDGWAGKFQGNKAPCKSLKKGLEELDKANAGVNPPEVTAAASKLRATIVAIMTVAQANKGACKL